MSKKIIKKKSDLNHKKWWLEKEERNIREYENKDRDNMIFELG